MRNIGNIRRVQILVLLLPHALAARSSQECPCLSNSSGDLYDRLRSELAAQGISADYGTTGCHAYDANLSLFGCEANAGSYCTNPWCYVDMTLCPLDEGQCQAAGETPGSDASPHCRTRRTSSSSIVNMSIFYSYETCGSMNLYDGTRHSEGIGGYIIKIAVDPFPPWVLTRGQGYGGASYDFFERSLDLFEPKPQIKVAPGWATEQSRQLYSSSYTACVHDVAIGNFDLCIADLWLTPERNQLATFLPPVRHDYFYLVVPKKQEEITFWTRLEAPLRPFTADAWLSIVLFLCGLSALLWLVQLCEKGFFKNPKGLCSWSVAEFGRSQFNVWHDFLLGQSSHDVERGPSHKLFSVAFAFFILVTLASYTASLASQLVIQRGAEGTIADINAAVDLGIKICVPSVLYPTFSNLYPLAMFESVPVIEQSARYMHAGRCGAMVVSQEIINSMHAGNIREQDCNSGLSEDISRCNYDNFGNRRDDCNFIRAGDLLWSVPLSFPVGDRIAHSGLLEELKENKFNKDAFPLSKCEVETRSEEDGLTSDDLSGTVYISIIIAAVGLLCFCGEMYRSRGDEAESSDPQDPKQEQPERPAGIPAEGWPWPPQSPERDPDPLSAGPSQDA